MSEKLSQPEENIENSFERTMQDVPTFDEHQKRNQAERLQRVLELAKITEARKNDEVFDESIQDLDSRQAFNTLNHINGILRGVNHSERGRKGNMRVGDYLAPQGATQKTVLHETTEAIKGIKDNHYRATLSYYMINALHLFGDGNGRTSRAVYEIFDDPDFDLADKRVIHKKDNVNGGVDQSDFEKENDIHSTSDALRLASAFMKEQAIASGKIDARLEDINLRVEAPFGDIYFTPEASTELSPQEKRAVSNSLHYNQDIGALALSDILTKKGTLANLIEDDQVQKYKTIVFQVEADEDGRVGKANDEAIKIFDGWTADDYRDLVRSARGAHKKQLETVIDFFANPDQYTFDDGSKAADWLSGSS